MKKIPNMIFLILGVIILSFELYFMIDGTLGWLLTTTSVILIGISIFKGGNPFKVIFEFITNIL